MPGRYQLVIFVLLCLKVLDGVAYKDGRLKRGDRIMSVNGLDTSEASQSQAVKAMKVSSQSQLSSIVLSVIIGRFSCFGFCFFAMFSSFTLAPLDGNWHMLLIGAMQYFGTFFYLHCSRMHFSFLANFCLPPYGPRSEKKKNIWGCQYFLDNFATRDARTLNVIFRST